MDNKMKKITVIPDDLQVPAIALGCMRLANMAVEEVDELICVAMEAGINFFDHADIYGGGQSEEVFAKAVARHPGWRAKMVLQGKCGIRAGYYDFSKEHILSSVDGILARLETDYLDLLLLHRPDTLMEPEEVAEAFDKLESSGKVRHFGVSNQNAMQMELMKRYVRQTLLFNQLQLSIMCTGLIDSGLNVNTTFDGAIDRDGSTLEYCRLNDVVIQAWSPFQYGFFEGVFIDNEKFPELNRVLDGLADEKGVGKSALAVAWIMRHPARIQTIVGTTNAQRLKEIASACGVCLTRPEWYEIYRAAGNRLP